MIRERIQRHKDKLILIGATVTFAVPTVMGATNTSEMTDSMVSMLVELMPIMLIVMIFKMMANAFGGTD